MLRISPIPAFTDNYIWCLQHEDTCVVVDPGDAAPVLTQLNSLGLNLSAILITHHHWDHTNGIDTLLARFPGIPVYGPVSDKISQITHPLSQGDTVTLPSLDVTFEVFEVPGHTLDHIAYYGQNALFCGDTLFSGGCGRLFEGTPAQMHASLGVLAELPEATRVYCTHEYTQANLAFALAVEPDNKHLLAYRDEVARKRAGDTPSLPSSIGREKAINPFLRVKENGLKSSVEQQAGKDLHTDADVFAALRGWKDNF